MTPSNRTPPARQEVLDLGQVEPDPVGIFARLVRARAVSNTKDAMAAVRLLRQLGYSVAAIEVKPHQNKTAALDAVATRIAGRRGRGGSR